MITEEMIWNFADFITARCKNEKVEISASNNVNRGKSQRHLHPAVAAKAGRLHNKKSLHVSARSEGRGHQPATSTTSIAFHVQFCPD